MCIKVEKCCCCVDLRTGAIVIAVLGIVWSFGYLSYSIDWLIITDVISGLIVSFCLLFGAIKVNEIAVLIYLILNVLQIILTFATGIFYLVGGSALKVVSQDDGSTVDTFNKTMTEEFLKEIEVNVTKHENDDSIYEYEYDEYDKNLVGAVGITAIIGGVCIILWACVQIYFFICMHSFYKKIKDGEITSAA